MANILGAEALVGEISTLLGLNKWELVSAKYNGCTFFSVTNSSLTANDITNALSDGEYIIKQFYGSSDINQNGTLFATDMGIISIDDTQEYKVIRKSPPYANGDNLEYQGNGGWTTNMVAIFIGADYKVAYDNFLNAIQNPPPKEMFKLVHPVHGLIKGRAILSKISSISEAQKRHAIVMNLTFEIEESQAWEKATDDSAQIANKAITSIVQSINAIGLGISLFGIISK